MSRGMGEAKILAMGMNLTEWEYLKMTNVI